MSVRVDGYDVLGSGTYGRVSRVLVFPPSAHDISTTIWAGKWIARDPMDIITWHQVVMSELCLPSSPSLPRLSGAWCNDEGTMIAMEAFESSAQKYMGKLPLCASLLRDVLCGLRDLHAAGVAHRDVKLENILMRRDRAVLCDFGLASSVYEAVSTETHVCTFPSRAPEIWASKPHTFSADLWSLGCVAYNLSSGKYIIPATKDASEIVQDLSRTVTPDLNHPAYSSKSLTVAYVMAKCLRMDPNERPFSSDLLASIADCRRKLVLRKRIASVPRKLSMRTSVFHLLPQRYLNGQEFVGVPTTMPLVGATTERQSELSFIRDALSSLSVPSFKLRLIVTDIYDRLSASSRRVRLCLAIYVGNIACNATSWMTDIASAVYGAKQSETRVKELENSFLPALNSLSWTLGTPQTCTYTILCGLQIQDNEEVRSAIWKEYERWPDARTRKEMVQDALK